MKQLPTFHLLFLILLTTESTEALSLAKKDCKDRCGEVRIPFPFGIGENCAFDKRYVVDCNSSIPYLPAYNDVEVLNVSLERQTITVNVSMTFDCQNPAVDSNQILIDTIHPSFFTGRTPFLFSKLYNIFVVAGCGNAVLMDRNRTAITGCSTTCSNDTFVDLKDCYGIGCCQATVPYHLQQFTLNLTALERRSVDGTCGSAFLVDKDLFLDGKFSLRSIARNHYYVPISLFWPLEHSFSGEKDLFLGENAAYNFWRDQQCRNSNILLEDGSISWYAKCECTSPQEGNPYIVDGCKNHKQCKECEGKGAVCRSNLFTRIYGDVNNPYNLLDSEIISEQYCDMQKSSPGVILGVSVSMGLLIVMVFLFGLHLLIKKTKAKRRKEKFFKRNGGLLLKQREETEGGLLDKIILFTSKELETATGNYNENRIVGQGGQGTVYKGMLVDGRIIAVKKSKSVDESQLDHFINEVFILSQVNHRNVVKLLGFCLETQSPQLVFEFVPNGTLYDFIQDETHDFPITLNTVLQIATEVAGALSYLHSATSIPIYHRDIKTKNILLDEKYRAKVSDFGTSKFVALDKTHVTTLVKGTFGYLDPEYFRSNQFTEKSDVYSFGVVLLELFTREKPIISNSFGEHISLANHFMSAMEEDRVMSIFDPVVVKEDSNGVLSAIANLAMRCLNSNGTHRPTMKEVAMDLEDMRMSHVPSTSQTSFGH